MPPRTDRPPLLPPPLAAWLGARTIRAVWAGAGVVLIWAWVALESPAASSGRVAPVAAPPVQAQAPTALASPPATRPAPAVRLRSAVLRPSGPRPKPAPPSRRAAPAPRLAVPRVAPPRTVPPAPGRYAYTVTTDNQSSPAELVVDDLGQSGGGALREEDWSTDAGVERRGEEWSTGSEGELWSSDGTSECDYRPPSLWLALPLSVGRSWSGNSSCSYVNQDGQSVDLQQSLAARVVAAAHAELDGRRTFCWVVERDVLTTVTTGGTVATSETRTTDLFAPALGLVLFQTGKSAYPDSAGNIQSYTWTAQLDG